MRRLAVLAGLLLSLLVPAPALAADDAEVAASLAERGYYVEAGSSLSAAEASDLVEEARFAGSRFYLVVLTEGPDGGATFFAEAVFDRLIAAGATSSGAVVVLTPDAVGWVTENDEFSDSELDAALAAANEAGGDDSAYLAAFVGSLAGVPVAPGGSGTTAAPASGGGGGGVLVLLLVVGGLVLLGVWAVRRSRKAGERARADRVRLARAEIQTQLDAVANDVLELADEVRVAENEQAETYYQQATATYSEVSERFEDITDATGLLDLSERLDEAIWQLDAAEALLDGKPVPPRPEPRPEPQPQPQPAPRPEAAARPAPAPPPSYQRRSARRSSYVGSNVMDILIGVGSVLASSRGGRRRGGGLLGGLSRSSRPGSRRVLPGPSRRSTSTPTRRSSSRSTSRSRGGGRRRR